MTDEHYKDMVIEHDKHIDSLASSVGTLALNVGATNEKLNDVINVMTHQNVLIERMNNLDTNVAESFKRAWRRLEKLEDSDSNGGCHTANQLNKEKEAVKDRIDTAVSDINKIESDIRGIEKSSISGATIQWIVGILIFYSIAFGVYVVTELHNTDTALASYIARDTEVGIFTNEKLEDVISLLRDADGKVVQHPIVESTRF